MKIQIFGGMGFMRDMEINGLYRTVKTSEIAGGSMEIRKLIVAKELGKIDLVGLHSLPVGTGTT